ncbi:hypothetical protein ABPG74_002230 [Tetrahymena malaccensis]
MFRQEVSKQKQKSFDFQSPQNHPSNSLISFMNRTQKITRVHTDNSDGKNYQEQAKLIQSKNSELQITRVKSKSVYQPINLSQTPDTPNELLDSINIHNAKYKPSKFKLSANQLLNQQDHVIVEDLQCYKCKNISDEIKECLGCGHLFCKDCVSSSDNACCDEECSFSFENQQDKRNLRWDLREPSKIIQKKINQLQFKCLNQQLGCDAVLDIKCYADHVDHDCEYMIIECPNQNKECQSFSSSPTKQACLYFGPKKYMKDHLQICNLKQFNSRDQSKQNSNDERSLDLIRRIQVDDINTFLHSSQEESNIFERANLQNQNSQFTSKIISLGDEYVQSQMDEIIDLNKKICNQSQLILKQNEQIDKYSEENRKLKDQLEKYQKETDLKISKLQASSTQVMLEMQSMKKMYSEKITELFQQIKEIKGESFEKSLLKSQSGGVYTKFSHNSINNSFMNQTINSQQLSEKSEQNILLNTKYYSSNQLLSQQEQLAIKSPKDAKFQNLSTDLRPQQSLTPRQGSLFTAKLEEIKTLNGDNSVRNKKNSLQNGPSFFDTQETQQSYQYKGNNSDNNSNGIQSYQCKQCFSKLIYSPKQYLNVCSNCFKNQYGIYYCQNCPSRFYCIDCCPLYIKKGFCPNNHALIVQSDTNISQDKFVHRCNICSKIFAEKVPSKLYSCQTCDFDLCSGCMNMKYVNS